METRIAEVAEVAEVADGPDQLTTQQLRKGATEPICTARRTRDRSRGRGPD